MHSNCDKSAIVTSEDPPFATIKIAAAAVRDAQGRSSLGQTFRCSANGYSVGVPPRTNATAMHAWTYQDRARTDIYAHA